MRVLFTFIGGLGHFYPLEPVVRAVSSAGHDVLVAGSAGPVAQLARAGFATAATSAPRPPPADSGGRDLQPLAPTDARAAEIEFAQNFADRGARRHAAALPEIIGAWRPDLVVRDEADFGSGVAAEGAGVRVATVLVLAAGLLIRPELVAEPLARLRAEHGLEPDPDAAHRVRGPVLAPFPPSFRSPAAPVALPDDTCWFRPGARVTPVPSATRPGRPRVYVTLGTVFNSESGDLFERLLAGVAGIDADVLVTVGRDIDPATFGPQPGHVRVERFVPQEEVLSRTDLVVSHGGSGSLMATLAHGLPSVLLPLGADQPHNTRRAVELGLALTLDAAAASPDEIRRAVERGLADAALATHARRMAEEIGGLPGPDEALRVLGL